MRNIFEFKSEDEENLCDKFAIRSLPAMLRRERDDMTEAVKRIKKRCKVPFWVDVIFYASIIFTLIMLFDFIFYAILEGFKQTYAKAGWELYSGVAGLIIAVALFTVKLYRYKRGESNYAELAVLEKNKLFYEQCHEKLEVPRTADDIDIFTIHIKTKNGFHSLKLSPERYANTACKIFADEEKLYISDGLTVYAFDLAGFNKLVKINNHATFDEWNKSESSDKGNYRQYEINAFCGIFSIKSCYSLRFSDSEEDYEILFPSYELETLLKYLNNDLMFIGNED